MRIALIKEIKNQLKEGKYEIVAQTLDRLNSLDLDKDQVNRYLNWAYSSAFDDEGVWDEQRYFQNLNQLPLMEDLDAPQKVVKSLTIDEALKILSDLLYQQTSSLQDILVEYWYGQLILGDGYDTKVRILSQVRPIELAEVLATREGIDEIEDIEIIIRTQDSPIILNDYQVDEEIGELVEAGDRLEFYFRNENEKIVIEFEEKSAQVFHAIESIANL